MAAGYKNRGDFAAALGLTWGGYDAWEAGRCSPRLEHFARAAELVGYTMDELYYGPPHSRLTPDRKPR